MLQQLFYEKCANILNENCIIDEYIDKNFSSKDRWDGDKVKYRQYCYTGHQRGGCYTSLCSNCKNTLLKITLYEPEIWEQIDKYESKIYDKYEPKICKILDQFEIK